MFDYLKKVGGQVAEFLQGLSPQKKVGMVVLFCGILIGMGAVFQWASQQVYRPLMTNLTQEDSSNILRILRQRNIPFRMANNGKSIEVPEEAVFDLRLELATMGLPDTSVVGYEVFDQQSLGTTSFVQKVNKQRALEGELIRSIMAIKGVKRSRVHLAIPTKSTFVEDQKDPSASVVVDLEHGVRLSDKQIYGIGRMVANAVEGLEPDKVVIVDASGKMLSKNTHDPIVALTASQLDYRRQVEKGIEKRVVEMLSPVVGEGKVVAKVSAEINFSRVDQTQTVYDNDSRATLSQETHINDMKGSRPGPAGAAGATTNQPGEVAPQPPVTRTDTKNERTVSNFKIPSTVTRTRLPTGTVDKLSVAVVVDGQTVKEKNEEGEVTSKVVAWSDEKLVEFQEIVSSAVGFDEKRGDKVEIKNIQFKNEDFEEAEELLRQAEQRRYIRNLIGYGIVGLIVVLFFWLVVRPFVKWVTENTIDSVDTFLPQTLEELEKMQKNQNIAALEEVVPVLPEKIDPEKVEGEMIKEKIITLVDNNPHKAALVLRDWVRGDKNKDKEKKEGE